MSRPALHPAYLLAAVLLCAPPLPGVAQTTATRDAVAAMQHGDFPAAETILRAEVRAHPADAWALSLLGVALDNLKKVPESEEFHIRATALSPNSAEILNNYGTHLWIAGQYGKAEAVFTNALAAAPQYFQTLFNLGIMATYTGHYERAREVLGTALQQQPQNVDLLYRLAYADEASRQLETAVMHLAQAAKLDPRRADVQKLLAVTTTELGALDDAAAAWDRYLQLVPSDDAARRERGYTLAKMGKLAQGIADLEWFVAGHPGDAAGHYELGQAERTSNIPEALSHFDKALAIDPKYAGALSARGSLYYQEGKPELAVADLERAASLRPDDSANLDRLGQTYQALNRSDDAVRVLDKAAQLAPEDSTILLHFGRALADAGKQDESKLVMDRFRQLGPEKKKGVPAGLVDYLALPPEQRRADYRGRVEKAVREHPDDSTAQIDYLKLMLEDGNPAQAAAAAKRIAALKPGPAVLAAAGHALLEARQYTLAKDLLGQATSAPEAADARLDLAIATFRAANNGHADSSTAQAALKLMDGVPDSERSSDYHLARAEMLAATAAVDFQNVLNALAQSLRLAGGRPEIYLRANAILIDKVKPSEALRAIEDGARALPENREILLRKATTLEFAGQSGDCATLLNEIRSRWPEWPSVWLAQGIILDSHQHFEEAKQAVETAVALGAHRPEAYFLLAANALRSKPEKNDAAEAAIAQALKLAPDDPWIQSLAGRIAFANGNLHLAAERQRTAIRLSPRMIAAHDALARTYAALGRREEADVQRKLADTLRRELLNNGGSSDESPYLGRLFDGALLAPSH